MQLEREFNFYKEHQDELAERYKGRYIAIMGRCVVGVYGADEPEAINKAWSEFEPGTVMIVKPVKASEEEIRYVRSVWRRKDTYYL